MTTNNEELTIEPDGSRAEVISQLLRDLEAPNRITLGGSDRALAVLVTDAVLARDDHSLRIAHDGLQQLYSAQLADRGRAWAREVIGETYALLTVVDWTLKRVQSAPGRATSPRLPLAA